MKNYKFKIRNYFSKLRWKIHCFIEKVRGTNKRFRKQNYPVTVHCWTSGLKFVLVRNLTTHQYGGWWIQYDYAVEEWGQTVIDKCEVNMHIS